MNESRDCAAPNRKKPPKSHSIDFGPKKLCTKNAFLIQCSGTRPREKSSALRYYLKKKIMR